MQIKISTHSGKNHKIPSRLLCSDLYAGISEDWLLVYTQYLNTCVSQLWWNQYVACDQFSWDLFQMEELSEDCSLNDDMVDGDLGDGIGVTTALSSTRMKSERVSGRSESRLLRADPLQCSSRAGEAVWTPTIQTAETQQRAQRELSYSGNNVCFFLLHRRHQRIYTISAHFTILIITG